MGDLTLKETTELIKGKSEEAFQYLTFVVSGERFAIDILEVREIIEVGLMTDVPLAPDYIRGVVNLRGSVLPVIDLAARIGRERSELTKRSCIVVVDLNIDGKQSIGMLVDEVREILEIAPDMVQPPPALGEGMNTDLIKGMGRVGELFIVLLEVDRILSADERQTLEHMSQQQASGP
jgi:purine-binding chemotaxis protein CheW